MYDINSVLIAAILFVSMALAIEIGDRIGRLFERDNNESTKAHVNSIQASLLGIPAPLWEQATRTAAKQTIPVTSGLIIDLDRPRRGLIEVSQASLTDLQLTLDPGAAGR